MRHHARAGALALAVLLATGLFASPGFADGGDRAVALDLFARGRELFKDGSYEAALEKFEAAGRTMRTFGILLNIAECQERIGHTASAWATWREARAVASEAHHADDETLAAERQSALEARLSRLTVVVPAGTDAPEPQIRRDGGIVAPPVSSASAPAPVAPIPARPSAGASDSGSGQRVAGWILGGFGLAGVGTGIGIALVGQSKHDEAVATDRAGNLPLAQEMESTANTTKIVGYAILGGGGAFLISGVILLLTAHSPSSSSGSALAFKPWVSPAGGAGATFTEVW